MRMERAGGGGGGPLVTGLGRDGFRIGDDRYRAVLLTVERAIPWSPPALAALTVADLAPILDDAPEFVLFGSGATLARPPRDLIAALEARGIGIEAMDSRAAARAWGVLRSEGRQIAAALLPLG